jgi:uncharacterized membrane protein YfcA
MTGDVNFSEGSIKYMMHFKLSQQQVKRVIALLLYILAIKMAWEML